MHRVFHVLVEISLPVLVVAQTLVPLPLAGPVKPGDNWAVISGKLTDEDGLPVADALLEAGIFWWHASSGMALCGPCFFGRTDDYGAFRIRVQPGRHHLFKMGTNSWQGYASQFYGGAVVPRESGVIDVKAGEDRVVDFRLTTHAGATITGLIMMPESARTATAPDVVPSVSLLNESRADLIPPTVGEVQSDGRFEIRNLRPGKYVLRAQTGDDWAKAGNFLVEREVQVGDSDLSDVVLPLHLVEPAELSGTVALESGASPGPLMIGLMRRGECELAGGTISGEDGVFLLRRVLPGHYWILVMPDPRPPRVSINGKFPAGRVSAHRDASAARPRIPILVSAYLGDKDILLEGFDFDGIVPGPLRLTVRPPAEQQSRLLYCSYASCPPTLRGKGN